MRARQHAQGSGNVQVALGFRAAVPLIDKDFVNPQQLSQRQCGPFPGSRNRRGRVRVGGSGRTSSQSGGCAIHDRTAAGAPLLRNSAGDGLGHNHVRVERLEHVHCSDQHEIIERARIGHNDHAERKALRLSFNSRIVARSRSKSSTV
mgnify:CR=1 FL=1